MSLHQVPTILAHNLVTEFDTATINSFAAYIADTVKHLDKPNPIQLLDIFVYLGILLDMGTLAACMFVITSFGFVGTGLMTVLGPLFIPLALTKRFYSWFWNWLQALVAFAMYRVMATVVGWVWANVYIYFFVHGVGTDYSIANWIALLPIVLMLTVAFLYTMFKIPAITASLLNSAGAIGQGYIDAGTRLLRAAIA
jgi:type IV secretion system protein VirB6